MSEYLVQRQSLENIADEIRVLSGATEPLGLTEMATNVNDANDEVADQTDLIAQVVSALQGKSVPGGGEDVTAETETYTDLLTDLEAAVDALPEAGGSGSGGAVETCDVTIEIRAGHMKEIFYVSEAGEVINEYKGSMIGSFTGTVRKGSVFCVASAMDSFYSGKKYTFNGQTNYADVYNSTAYILVNESDTFTLETA